MAGQIGLEATLDAFVARLVDVYHEVRRVLKPTGTCWINIGDSYDNSKNLLMIPARLMLALQADGWIVRSEILWFKATAMPESVRDRPTLAHEMVYLLAKCPAYWCDMDAVRKPSVTLKQFAGRRNRRTSDWYTEALDDRVAALNAELTRLHYVRSAGGAFIVGDTMAALFVAPQRTALDHFAAYPEKLVEPMVLAGCPERCCAACGKPLVRVKKPIPEYAKHLARYKENSWYANGDLSQRRSDGRKHGNKAHDVSAAYVTVGFEPSCACGVSDTQPGVVLDMFAGTGTTALVARRLGRDYLMNDLSPVYCDMMRLRLAEPFTTVLAVDVPGERTAMQLSLGGV